MSSTSASGSDQFLGRVLVVAVSVVTVSVAYLPPVARSMTTGAIHCGFFRLTGLLCPLCGMTRATVALLNGRFREALFLNPLSFVYVAALGWALFATVCGVGRRPRGEAVGVVTLLTFLSFGVARNVW